MKKYEKIKGGYITSDGRVWRDSSPQLKLEPKIKKRVTLGAFLTPWARVPSDYSAIQSFFMIIGYVFLLILSFTVGVLSKGSESRMRYYRKHGFREPKSW